MNVGKSGCCCLSSCPHSPPSMVLPPLLSPPVGLQLSISQQRPVPSPFYNLRSLVLDSYWRRAELQTGAHVKEREGEGGGVCKVPRGGWFKRQVAFFSRSTSVMTSMMRTSLLFLHHGSYRGITVCLYSRRLSKAGRRNQIQH